jgi:diguanylate cyclase (GGDEF)-like protein/PAS domain S-box-containing protein
MKVQQKLLGAFLAAAALVAIPTGLVLYSDASAARRAAISEAEEVALGIAREVTYSGSGTAAGARPKPFIEDPAALAEYLQHLHDLQHRDIAVIGRDLRIVGDVIPEEIGEIWTEDQHGEVAATIADGRKRTFSETSDDYPDGIQQVVVPIIGPSKAVEGAVVLEFTPLYRQMADVTRTAERVIVVAGPLCVLLVLLLGVLVARSITRRIKTLTRAVIVVRNGNYAERVKLSGDDEIALLGHAFDDMAGRLETAGRDVLAKEYADSVLANAGEGVCGVDADGRITFANDTAGRITGLGVDGLLGREAAGLLPSTDRGDPGIDNEREGTLYRHDGSSLRLAFTHTPIARNGVQTGAVLVLRDVTRQRSLERELRLQALHDSLTGLPNRRLFLDRLARAVVGSRSSDEDVAVLHLNLDGFRKVNESLGHSAADVLLQEVAARLSGVLRPQDTVARLDGDEFAALLDGVRRPDAEGLAQACVKALGQPFDISGRKAAISVSVGVVPDAAAYGDADEVLRHANIAMSAAKARGKAGYQVYERSVSAPSAH